MSGVFDVKREYSDRNRRSKARHKPSMSTKDPNDIVNQEVATLLLYRHVDAIIPFSACSKAKPALKAGKLT